MRNQEQNGKCFCRRIPLSAIEKYEKKYFRNYSYDYRQNKNDRDDDNDKRDSIMIKIKWY